MPLTTLTVILLGAVCILTATLFFLVWRRRSRDPQLRLTRAANAIMNNVVVGDADGEVQLEYALLTPRGILLVNLKQVDGNVFASDSMHEWAVITPKGRFGFANPQDGLFDRLAAVRRLLPDTPVEGCIAFCGATVFAKGVPSHAKLFDELIAELEASRGDADKLMPDWLTLKSLARKG